MPLNLQPATTNPRLCQRLLDTHSWASLGQSLVGSLLLSSESWCTKGFVCTLQESVSPVLCKFCQLCGGVNGDLLQEGLCHTQVCCTQNPCSLLMRHPDTVLSQFLWGLWVLVRTDIFKPSEHLWRVWGLILNMILPLLPPCWGFSFALGCKASPQSPTPALRRHRSQAYCLAGALLPLDVGYLRTQKTTSCKDSSKRNAEFSKGIFSSLQSLSCVQLFVTP